MTLENGYDRDLVILEQIEQDPDTTQAALASTLEVAVGTINWHLKRLIEKGYVKVSRVERRKLKYIITAEGIALRTRLTLNYIQNSFNLFRLVRKRMQSAIAEVKAAGYDCIQLKASGDLAEVCRLTCMEEGVTIKQDGAAPILRVEGLKIFVEMEDRSHHEQ
ncbi:MAG: winged helix-turn-helix domain-containing protein [Anaerolineaceae bacterium]